MKQKTALLQQVNEESLQLDTINALAKAFSLLHRDMRGDHPDHVDIEETMLDEAFTLILSERFTEEKIIKIRTSVWTRMLGYTTNRRLHEATKE